jgi:hypothetical protein
MEDGLQLDMECDGHLMPWRSILKHGEFSCGSMGFWVFSRARSLIQRPRYLGNTSTLTLQSSVSSSGTFIAWVLKHSLSLIQLYCDAHYLHSFSKYFKRELESLGALQKADLPLYLSTWLLKSSLHCMYTWWDYSATSRSFILRPAAGT